MSILEVGSDSDADGASVHLKPGAPSSATGERQSRARGATPRELAAMLSKLLGGGSVLLAMWIDVEEAALTADEATAIAEPLARIINRSNMLKPLAKRLLGADDYLALTLALFSYGMRVYPLIAQKATQNRDQSRPAATPVRPPASQPAQQPVRPASNGHINGHIPDYDLSRGVPFVGTAGVGFDAE